MDLDLAWVKLRALDKADVKLTLSSGALYNIGSHLPFYHFNAKERMSFE